MKLYYDLHMHSCLSPCGDAEMTPANIANMAAAAGLDVIALSDHNSTRNCPALLEAAGRAGLLALPAMELTTAEEVHVLCLLPDLEAAERFGRYVYERLPDVKNRPEIFGAQLVMDGGDGVLAEEERLLMNATSIGIYETAELLRAYGGIAIPAHADRSSFSVLANLGFIAPEMGFSAVELTPAASVRRLLGAHPELRGLAAVADSDAHYLEHIRGRVSSLEAEAATPRAVIEALRRGSGLRIL